MKVVCYGSCIAIVIFGLVFYLVSDNRPARSAAIKPLSTRGDSSQNPESISTVTQSPTTVTARGRDEVIATATSKKKCACCRETSLRLREVVKQKRQALEIWARETIANYGYEEGMKRVMAKSPVLAERIQRLLAEEKRSGQTGAISQSPAQ